MFVMPQVPPPPGIFQDTTLRQDTSVQRSFPFPDLIDTSSQIQSQQKDSLRAYQDTSDFEDDMLDEEEDFHTEKDTIQGWEVYLDSTARINQFIHSRYDAPMVEMFPRKKYSLYLDVKSPAYKRQIELDSAGQFVTVREMVNGLDIKIPTTMTLDEYIHHRSDAEKLNNWRSMTEQYTLKQDKDDLSGFLGSLTNISIPVPANPLTNIFGGNEINLRISGAVDIRAAFRNTTSDRSTISPLDRSSNTPDFNQNVQINVGGTIGKKLNILADWNTQRTFEYENQLRIRYTGFDDEIIQSIEAGNVSLQTPSLVGGGQALFGIKSKLQAGPLTLTTLLSQKKGQTKELTVSGGATTQEINIQPHEYSKNNFFLDTVYIKYFEELRQSQVLTLTPEIQENQIIQLDVFLSVPSTPQYRQIAREAISYIDLPSHQTDERYSDGQINQLSTGNGRYYKGLFIQLDPNKDYKVDQYAGYITLQTSYNENQVIAVSYTTVGKNNINQIYGGHVIGNDTIMYLKLVKPEILYPSHRPAWDLLLKNFYSVRATNLKKEGFNLKIWRRTEGNDVDEIYGENLLTVLGLDRFDQYNASNPDNSFDFMPGFTVDVDKGVIIFPSLRPFDSTIVRYFRKIGKPISDSLLFSDIYDTTAQAAQNNSIKNRYTIKVEAAGVQSSRYNLGFNLVEGSVQVLLNGNPLTPNVDYTVDYIVGEVVIRKPEALLPGANVQVKYEQNDLFQIASKTLIGARGELKTFKNTNLGFTIMNLNQETLSDKVRIGEEPTNNTMLGIDASTSTNVPFITDAIDALPIFRTKEMSTLQFSGEAAYMLPDANTKKSSVSGDRGASIAYLDDFEGTRRSIPFPIMYTAWSLSSPPSYTRLGLGIREMEKTYAKGRLIWYNRLPTDVVTEDIWPNRRTRAGQNQVTVLNLDYDPNHRGLYNFSPNLDSSLHRQNIGPNTGKFDNAEERRKNWNGLTRYIGSTAGSILEQNISYLEIWMQATSNENNLEDLRRGRIYINLGRVSEDVVSNRELNSEDILRTSTNPLGIPNGILNEGEDVGLDMKNNSEESIAYASFLTSNSGDPDVDPSDPSGDNWLPYGDGIDLRKFNGSEDNKRDPSGLLPNTEDLNGNGSVDLAEQYVEYELPLDTVYYDSTGTGPYKNIYHVGGGNNGWYQFRIPLLETARIIGGSSSQEILQNVQHIRIWVSGFAHPISIRIAEINLIGNQWQERMRNDSLLKVSIVNIEDNPEYAREWNQLGIVREKDRTDPNQIIEANEQSLALLVKELPPDISREVVKYFTVRPLDIFNYKSMKMFVHGDPTFNPGDAEIFLRFGSDTMNFYEYRHLIHPGWDLANNEVKINFGELTSVKAVRPDSLLKTVYTQQVDEGPDGATYGVKGNPSLRQIREISIGIKNKGTSILRGEVWVNELRLVEVDNSPGIAFRFGSQMKLADLGAVSFNYAQTDQNFHGLDQRFGNQTTNINWGVNANVLLDKLFPQDWQGTSIPIAYSHSENLIKPRYLPNTDIVVQEVANRAATPDASKTIVNESQTLNVRDTYSLSNFKIVPPTPAWYIRDTFTKLSLSVNYGTTSDRDPAFIARKSWQWSLRVNYGVSLPGDYYFQPFKRLFDGIIFFDEYKNWKFYYIPITNISTGIGGQRSRSYEIPRAKSAFRETRNFGGSKSAGFGWKFTEGGLSNISGDYSLSIDRNLLPLDNDSIGRGFMEIMKSLFFRGQDNRYGQRVAINTKPKIPNILDIPKYFDLSAGYSVGYAWQNNFQKGDIGKSAGFDNNITLSLGFRLKSLTDPWFESKPITAAAPTKPDQRARSPKETESQTQDSTKKQEEKASPSNISNIFSQLKTVTKYLIKIPLLDYETINISYTQGNRSGNGAVVGSTGFQNFWGRLPFEGSRLEYGPSRLYQLGLIADPSGTLRFSPKSKFPFLGWKVTPGLRAPKASFTDQYSQSNNIALRTNRPLWKGATIDFNWKVGWHYSRNTTVVTDSLGVPKPGEPTTSGSIERSFVTFPPVFLFKSFKSNLEEVGKRYDKLIYEGQPTNVALAESFEKGLEALPFLSKLFGQYAPRANWTIRWDGIDKISFLNYAFDRLSLEHNYTSSFRRDFRSYPGKGERTDGERISYGFTPLVGLNMTFKQLLKGNFSGNFRYGTTTSYDLNLAASQPNIVSTMTQEMALSLSYSRRGFSFPLFGWSLSNDVDFSFSYSRTTNTRRRYEPQYLSIDQEGIPLEGNTRTTLEPRIRYVLSTRVTAAIFYRYSKTEPDATGSLIFGTTTNEGGLDIHISI
ncbi:MAG: cell surface protein SprA [Bacteroidota bacterium]|nr:cell surface protein SprA [Bacteroidota bacterium]